LYSDAIEAVFSHDDTRTAGGGGRIFIRFALRLHTEKKIKSNFPHI
jgi:hypothetical protein